MNLRKIRNRAGALVLGAMVLALGGAHRRAHGDDVCGDPGTDGAFSGGGIVNTYYPPAADGTIDPTTPKLALGTPTGASATLRYGAMLLIIQMQDAEINSLNDSRYGDGVQEVSPSPDQGSGTLHINATGVYEYVIVDDGSTAFGTPVPDLSQVDIVGTGPNGRLINTYTNAASTATRGQRRYQIVRIPQYTTVTLNSALAGRAWNGSTGGILAIDVAGDLILNNATVNVTGIGFRGGFGEKLSSGAPIPKTTYRETTAINAFGNKGEGIAGTPKMIAPGTTNPEGEGYPNGSRARGAPGNAGGGGNPDDPSTNTDSSGGGGGGNGGSGGQGGNTGNSNLAIGGFGGSPFVLDGTTTPAWTAGRIIMGGGGGSGTKNNTTPGASDGGAGGGILMIRANRFSRGVSGTQTGTFTANGAAGADGNNNGGGGGGAGGTVILTSLTGSLNGVTINARGGDGGPAGTGTNKYGPGGGGGGGVILISGTGAVVHTEAGANGVTNGDSHGALQGVIGSPTPGTVGNPLITPGNIPGAHSGAECLHFEAVDDLYATPANVPLTITAPGVMANDLRPQGFTFTVLKDSSPNPVTEGSVTLNSDGSFTFTPVASFLGSAVFTYHMNNGSPSPGGDSNIATVTIVVGGNVNPAAVADAYSATEDMALNVAAPGVLGNDSDLNGDTLHAVLDATTTHGTLVLNDDGSFDYTPDPDYKGPDSFTYHVSDGNGGTSSTVAVSITVASVNDAPVAVADSGYLTVQDTPLSVAAGAGVLVNDTDVDGDTFTAVLDANVSNGVLVLNPDGSFTYTPNGGYSGPDSFTYHANDGNLDSNVATVSISVVTSNVPPVAVADAYTIKEGHKLVLAASGILANDSDGDGNPITAVLDTGTSNGTLTVGADGSVTYTPDKRFTGIDSFQYHAFDQIAPSNVVTVTITVLPASGHFRAGYCGSTGLDLLFPLGVLMGIRRWRAARSRRSSRSTT